jgi:phosphopantothenoylcysteine decarboxylase/phosphopantothenate--cysteine ligase
MFDTFRRYYDHYDIVVMAAAVSDYRPKKIYPKKIKKENQIKGLDLVPNPDILSWASKRKKSHLLIGFAAETDHVIANARKKLIKKDLDMIVANRVGQVNAGFESDDIEFSIIENGRLPEPLTVWKKKKLAVEIVRRAIKRKANDP